MHKLLIDIFYEHLNKYNVNHSNIINAIQIHNQNNNMRKLQIMKDADSIFYNHCVDNNVNFPHLIDTIYALDLRLRTEDYILRNPIIFNEAYLKSIITHGV